MHGSPADHAIHLSWAVNTTLPPTATWRIIYTGPSGDPASPIPGLPEPIRSQSLTGLTNYTLYAITLNAMLDGAPVLTDTVTVMPTDRIVVLPQIAR